MFPVSGSLKDIFSFGNKKDPTKIPSNFSLQLRGPAIALSRKFLHDLTTARHFKSFF
jgi:hypothetical protein